MTTFDLLVAVIGVLVTVCGTLALLWRQAVAEASEQERRAKEWQRCWHQRLLEYQEAIERLHRLEQKLVGVQGLYSESVRQLLARNFYEIEMNVRRRRQAE